MNTKIKSHLSKQPEDRRDILTLLHKLILDNDQTVTGDVGLMMGKEMIIYTAKGMMKYALASGKSHMSLHVLPMYMNKGLFEKFKALLPNAAFQKGCINFKEAEAIPPKIIAQLIDDCSVIDLVAIREKHQAEKKKARK
jgi:hypothetical protein